MRVRWTRAAIADLDNIGSYLTDNSPSTTESTLLKLYDAAQSLKRFPNRGRIGRMAGTRELVIAPLSFVMVYLVAGEIVHIVRVLHGAQNWPGIKRD